MINEESGKLHVRSSSYRNQRDYEVQMLTTGFSYPTSLTFDNEGIVYLAESGLSFDSRPLDGGRIWKVEPTGTKSILLDGLRTPVNGLTYHKDSLYISEGGYPGRISRYDFNKVRTTILDNLPGAGNYHTNMLVFGPDEKIYFSQGAMTNTGIIGLDSYELGWLRRLPHAHDIPGYDIVLAGHNVETPNPFNSGLGVQMCTGAFVPFGICTKHGQRISGQIPCTAAVMRCDASGDKLELVAWGLRNAYGLGFMPDGRLIAIDQGSDDRGSRPVGNAPDLLFHVRKDSWYGWPDFIGGDPITDTQFRSERGPVLNFVLANHRELPPPERPLVRFPPHSAAAKFDIASSDATDWKGQIFVALFGDERPITAPPGPPVGRSVVRVDPHDWSIHSFLAEPLIRPIDVRFNPIDGTLYILDFGKYEVNIQRRVVADAGSGRLWRVLMK